MVNLQIKKNTRTLNKNNPCKEPAERARHNEPDGATPKEPDCRDLGYLVRDMAKSIQSLSMEMARLSGFFNQGFLSHHNLWTIKIDLDVLIHDDVYSEKTAAEYYKVKKLIQNVMDSTRYLSPELQIFSSFIVPIQESHSAIIENHEQSLTSILDKNDQEKATPRRTLSLVTHANVKSFNE